MDKSISTYCPECDVAVDANIEHRTENLSIRGENVSYDAEVAVCPNCHRAIGDSRLEDGNLQRAYAVYCEEHGLMSSEQIKNLRESYGLSLRDFSKFLGFGEQTVYRYESGSIPSESHNTALKFASSHDGASMLLQCNGGKLSQKAVGKIEDFISRNENDASSCTFDTNMIERNLDCEQTLNDDTAFEIMMSEMLNAPSLEISEDVYSGLVATIKRQSDSVLSAFYLPFTNLIENSVYEKFSFHSVALSHTHGDENIIAVFRDAEVVA